MQKMVIPILVMLTLFPLAATAQEKGDNSSQSPTFMDGHDWQTLKERSPQGSLLLYTSGFISGYDYALTLLQGVVESQNYDKPDLLEFMSMLKYPQEYENSRIKKIIDQFYSAETNRKLPLFVAFTYARQILNGYPEEYSKQYIENMRKIYAPEAE